MASRTNRVRVHRRRCRIGAHCRRIGARRRVRVHRRRIGAHRRSRGRRVVVHRRSLPFRLRRNRRDVAVVCRILTSNPGTRRRIRRDRLGGRARPSCPVRDRRRSRAGCRCRARRGPSGGASLGPGARPNSRRRRRHRIGRGGAGRVLRRRTRVRLGRRVRLDRLGRPGLLAGGRSRRPRGRRSGRRVGTRPGPEGWCRRRTRRPGSRPPRACAWFYEWTRAPRDDREGIARTARTCRGEARRAWRVEALASCLNVVAAATNALFVCFL